MLPGLVTETVANAETLWKFNERNNGEDTLLHEYYDQFLD